MGSGSSSQGQQSNRPGTLSPVTATLLDLFGAAPRVASGQFVPGTFNRGGVFGSSSFDALGGLLQNQPLSSAEQFILGAGDTPSTTRQVFDQAGFLQAANASVPQQVQQPGFGFNPATTGLRGRPSPFAPLPGFAAGPVPDPLDFLTTEVTPGNQAFGQNVGFQDLALAAALQSQGLLQQGADVVSDLLQGPDAAIDLARRGFTEETLPDILERAPGFSSSDLQRELTRAGTDLETNIAALRETTQAQLAQGLPAFANAFGTNLLEQGAQLLGFGQLGRQLITETSPAGDAFRVLSALQGLTGPALTNVGLGSQRSKSVGVL
jgi:hypothetical protein